MFETSRRDVAVAGLLGLLLMLMPLAFGVGFSYSLAAFEIAVLALMAFHVATGSNAGRDAAVLLLLCIGFLIHLVVLNGGAGNHPLHGTCLEDLPARSRMDVTAAFDGFRRGFVYLAVFLIVRDLADSKRAAGLLVGSIALCAAVLLALGLLAPRDSQHVLWFYRLPTYEWHWLSSSVHPLLTSLWAYAYPHAVDGLELVVDEFQISPRPIGPIFNENQYAAAIGVSFPLLLGVMAMKINRRGGRPWLLTLPLAALACGLIYWLTDSRAGAAAMLVSLAAFHLVAGSHARAKVLVLVALLGAATLAVGTVMLQADAGVELLGGRAIVWQQTVSAFLEQPWFGTGLGNYADLRIGFPEWAETRWYAAHNVYLQWFVELGLLGIAWCWLVLRIAAGSRSTDPARLDEHVWAGLFASVLFALVHGAIDYSPAMPFNAAIAAASAGLLIGPVRVGKRAVALPPLARRSGQVLVIGVALLLSASSVQFAYSQRRMFSTKDVTARMLSSGLRHDDDAALLRDIIVGNERACGLLPPRKDYLLASAYASLIVGRESDSSRLSNARELLAACQAIGRIDASLLPLQADLLTDATSARPVNVAPGR